MPAREGPAGLVRPAEPADVPELLRLIRELAAYERAPDAVQASDHDLDQALFGHQPVAGAHVALAEPDARRLVGMALWYRSFSTWVGRPGVYLEDLYVVPEHRGRGIGRALLATVAAACVDRGYGRLEWAVLDWNAPAMGFYAALGATPMRQWVVYRLAGAALARLAGEVPGGGGRRLEHAGTSEEGEVMGDVAEHPVGQRRPGEMRAETAGRDLVTLSLPATGAYLTVLRTATAGLAASLDFTLDEIEDLKIAVDEACAMLVMAAAPDAALTCRFELLGDLMRVSVTVPTTRGELPSRDSFGWTVLAALTTAVDARSDPAGQVTIEVDKRRADRGREAP